MSEKIIARNLNDIESWWFSYERDKFYNEQILINKEWFELILAVEVVNILLFNKEWDIILQKRANHKNHNAWLYDKSIWWHIQYWDTVEFTVMTESIQELHCPSIVVSKEDDYQKRLELLKGYLWIVSLVKPIISEIATIKKIMKSWPVNVANKYHLFFWVYDGSVRNSDWEVAWVLYYNFDELIWEMERSPDLFTEDLKFIVDKYKDDIVSFIELIKDTLD